MIKEADVKAFQAKNKQGDIMGVLRTIYPEMVPLIANKKRNRHEVVR
jgi:hypothetical protein